MSIEKIDKTYVELKGNRLSPSSILRLFNIMQDDDDEYFLNIFKSFDVLNTIMSDGTNLESLNIVIPWWEDITYTRYDDVDLWWVACITNDVLNPFEEIVEGENISLLKKQYIPNIHRDMERIFNL